MVHLRPLRLRLVQTILGDTRFLSELRFVSDTRRFLSELREFPRIRLFILRIVAVDDRGLLRFTVRPKRGHAVDGLVGWRVGGVDWWRGGERGNVES